MKYYLVGFVVSLLAIFVSPFDAESCSTPNNEPGECVIIENCPPLDQLMENHSYWSELEQANVQNYIKNSKNCSNNLEICCPYRHIKNYQNPIKKKPNRIKVAFLEPGSCGKSFKNEPIINGYHTKITEFPWMARIGYNKYGSEFEYNGCGGSLINDRYVLTAAHCLVGIPATWYPMTILLGEWDTTTDVDCQDKYSLQSKGHNENDTNRCENSFRSSCICAPPPTEMLIDQIIIHENYRMGPNHFIENDIALIRLQERVKYTEFIYPICLPFTNELRSLKFDGNNMTVSSWSILENKDMSIVDIKLKSTVPVESFNQCKEKMKNVGMEIKQTHICAGVSSKVVGVDSSVCFADGGSALFKENVDENKRPFFVIGGILSFGPTLCSNSIPDVYTRVTEYIDWIQENME